MRVKALNLIKLRNVVHNDQCRRYCCYFNELQDWYYLDIIIIFLNFRFYAVLHRLLPFPLRILRQWCF